MQDKLYYCEIKGNKEDTDVVVELFGGLSVMMSANSEVDEKITTYRVYTETNDQVLNIVTLLSIAIKEWEIYDVILSKPEISTINKEDWTEVWKKFFKIQHVTPTMVIKAGWHKYSPKPGEKVIEIEPGMSFGTGSHETTQLCLKMIEKISKNHQGESFLDAGCGSGILSIAAAMLGFNPIYAFDYDIESIISSKENFEVNKTSLNNVKLEQADIKKYDPGCQFDVVNANIISSVLVPNAERLMSWIKPGGYMILSGILKNEYQKVRENFITDEVKELEVVYQKEWSGGLFRKSVSQ